MKTIQKNFTINQCNIILNEILQNIEGVTVCILICSGASSMDSYARIQVYDNIQGCYKGVSYLYPVLMNTPTKLYEQCVDCFDNESIGNKIGHMFENDMKQLINEATMILKINLE